MYSMCSYTRVYVCVCVSLCACAYVCVCLCMWVCVYAKVETEVESNIARYALKFQDHSSQSEGWPLKRSGKGSFTFPVKSPSSPKDAISKSLTSSSSDEILASAFEWRDDLLRLSLEEALSEHHLRLRLAGAGHHARENPQVLRLARPRRCSS